MTLWPSGYKYEVFLSYDVDDRPVVHAILKRLQDLGLKVWYARDALPQGGDLEKFLYKAMRESRFAVCIVSPYYLDSNWCLQEYTVFRDRENRGHRAIFQVLHHITIEELRWRGSSMADKWSIIYQDNVDEVARAIFYEIRHRRPESFWKWLIENSWALRFWFLVFVLLSAIVIAGLYHRSQRPVGVVEPMLEAHVQAFQQEILHEQELMMASAHLQESTLADIQHVYDSFASVQSRYSNSYALIGDGGKLVSRVNVEQALQRDPALLSPTNSYNLPGANILLSERTAAAAPAHIVYALSNADPLQYEILESSLVEDGRYEILVDFQNNIRFLVVELTFPTPRDAKRHYEVRFMGFEAREKYAFIKNGDHWVLSRVGD